MTRARDTVPLPRPHQPPRQPHDTHHGHAPLITIAHMTFVRSSRAAACGCAGHPFRPRYVPPLLVPHTRCGAFTEATRVPLGGAPITRCAPEESGGAELLVQELHTRAPNVCVGRMRACSLALGEMWSADDSCVGPAAWLQIKSCKGTRRGGGGGEVHAPGDPANQLCHGPGDPAKQ